MSKEYKKKQEWLEAVMASDLTPATKLFAWGVFQHMYGVKTESNPGAAPLEKVTGLDRSYFPTYRKALFESGYLEGEVVKGRVYTYRLPDMLPDATSTCGERQQHLPPDATTLTARGNTNTTKKTESKTSMEDNKEEATVSDEPVGPVREVVGTDHSLNCVSRYACAFEGTKQQHIIKHMTADKKFGAMAAKQCWVKERL